MHKFKHHVEVERLKELLTYNKETGEFRWIKRTGREAGGNTAGFCDPNGYVQIRIDNQLYLAHRLAWAINFGEWPTSYIDHINGDKHDNRIANLRLCNQSQNTANAPRLKNNKSGIRGVYWHKQEKKWHVQLCKNRQKKSFGLYKSIEEAAAVAKNASIQLHGNFANHKPKQIV